MRLLHTLPLLFLLPVAEDNHPQNEDSILHGEKSIRGVRKMSNDEGEKFFLDYWSFHDSNERSMGNITDSDPARPRQIQPRSYPYQPAAFPNLARGLSLFQRDFQCPAGTSSCTSINRPSSCCASGDTCELVQDTGSGDVGCCPQGQTCSGVVGSCQSGYTACPASLGGGCCIPGYECVSGGCAYVSTVTVTIHSTVLVSTTTYTSPPSGVSIPSTSTSTSTSKTSTTDDLAPPARPTSLSTATTSQSGIETGSICPVGFYACSAVYQGGCCRTGRDCDTTSCPAISSTTIKSNNHETIVAPAATTDTAACAVGWFGCEDSMGGGCCPTGFACGSASCTATATGGSVSATGTVAKESGGGRRVEGGSGGLMGVLAAMVLLM